MQMQLHAPLSQQTAPCVPQCVRGVSKSIDEHLHRNSKHTHAPVHGRSRTQEGAKPTQARESEAGPFNKRARAMDAGGAAPGAAPAPAPAPGATSLLPPAACEQLRSALLPGSRFRARLEAAGGAQVSFTAPVGIL
jgi:hypothetical protein